MRRGGTPRASQPHPERFHAGTVLHFLDTKLMAPPECGGRRPGLHLMGPTWLMGPGWRKSSSTYWYGRIFKILQTFQTCKIYPVFRHKCGPHSPTYFFQAKESVLPKSLLSEEEG